MKPLASSKILELLYCLNTINHFEGFDSINEVTQSIIDFIDNNFNNIYELEDVTSQFHYSKNYLGYLFKKSTGITIMRYINAKKMENVEKLYKSGKSLTYACIESGFKSYDSFAYIYKKEFGIPPKKGFSKMLEKIY